MIFCDSHIHLSHSKPPLFCDDEVYLCVSSCHTRSDFKFLQGTTADKRRSGVPHFAHAHSSALLQNAFGGAPYPCAFASFGIHPQAVHASYLSTVFPTDLAYLESLLSEQKIVAIGECGFDFFTAEFKSTAREQQIVFEKQLLLAQKYAVPLVLHLRKSIEKIFSYSRELKKIPSVIFHSFPGTLREAESLAQHGINAFFSFGKPILNGKKSAIDCVKNLPLKHLLLETDAPYQTLKGETETLPQEIRRVYERASELRRIETEAFFETLFENFKKAYRL